MVIVSDGWTSRLLDRDQEGLKSPVSTAESSSITRFYSLLHPLEEILDFWQCKHSHGVFLENLSGDSAVLFGEWVWSEVAGERHVFAVRNGWCGYWRWGRCLVRYESRRVWLI